MIPHLADIYLAETLEESIKSASITPFRFARVRVILLEIPPSTLEFDAKLRGQGSFGRDQALMA